MTTYTVEANTGQSVWPVATFDTSPEVEAYLRTQSSFTPQVSPGNAGMYVTPKLADVLCALMDAQAIYPGKEEVHAQAIKEVAHLIKFVSLHSGAAINWSQVTPQPE